MNLLIVLLKKNVMYFFARERGGRGLLHVQAQGPMVSYSIHE